MIQRVLAIPAKRFDKRTITYLTAQEATALIEAPDRARWEGRRDRALLVLAIQTGLRVSELTGLNCGDVVLGTGAHVRCEGQGELRGEVPAVGWSFAAQLPSEPRGPGRYKPPDAVLAFLESL